MIAPNGGPLMWSNTVARLLLKNVQAYAVRLGYNVVRYNKINKHGYEITSMAGNGLVFVHTLQEVNDWLAGREQGLKGSGIDASIPLNAEGIRGYFGV